MDLFACLLRRYSDRRGSDVASLVLGYEPIMDKTQAEKDAEFMRRYMARLEQWRPKPGFIGVFKDGTPQGVVPAPKFDKRGPPR